MYMYFIFKICVKLWEVIFVYFKILYILLYYQVFLFFKKIKFKYIKIVFIVYRKIGMLVVGFGDVFIRGMVLCLYCYGIFYCVLDYYQMKQLYLMIEYLQDYIFVLDDLVGILMVDKVLLLY